ncbi:SLC13 family permease [Kordiimonas gwangyangensis]|uniref:SLC13 family permease n=1 Tax=Kordiimonas gwangyangensis TaxID=288022 RepID=UPI000371C54B|nr:SLC13 family permease [Kordiimonas gwangyangensis]
MELIATNIHMWVSFAVIIGAIILYASERWPVEVVSLGVIALLLLFFQLFPVYDAGGDPLLTAGNLLAGFAHPALITILALMVVGQSMSQTAALDGPTTLLLRYGRRRPRMLIFCCLIAVMVISAFLNDTPVVVMFLPIMIVLANKMREAPSQVLMPLSFAAILGGMTTLIGTSTNLLAAGAYFSLTGEHIDFFDFTIPGAMIALVGFTFLWFAAPRILPKDGGLDTGGDGAGGKQYIAQLTVLKGSPYEGMQAVSGMLPGFKDTTVWLIERGRQTLLPPFDELTLKPGDTLTLVATRDKLTDIAAEAPSVLMGGDTLSLSSSGEKGVPHLFEVLVPPASPLEGRTVAQVGAQLSGGSVIIGVQRRSRMMRGVIGSVRLEAGDILLVCGTGPQMRHLRTRRDVILMEWSGHALPEKHKKWIAQLVFLSVVASSASGLLPIVVASMLGAFAVVITGCLTIGQASRALNRQVFLLVGAALAMGATMEATGGAAFLGHQMVSALDGASSTVMLSALFLLVAVISNILSNNTTAILFTPIAVDVATRLDLPPLPFVVTVIFAANCSFATPVSYQTNLLVMGPGNYGFTDYMKLGIPLALVVWAAFSVVVPWHYGL